MTVEEKLEVTKCLRDSITQYEEGAILFCVMIFKFTQIADACLETAHEEWIEVEETQLWPSACIPGERLPN